MPERRAPPKLVLVRDGAARLVDVEVLPGLIEDAHDDAGALAALVEVALDSGDAVALSMTGPALARLRALADPNVDVAVLAAQVGIALLATRDVDARTSIAGVPVRAPVWMGALADAAPLVPEGPPHGSPASLPRVLLFALADESGAEAGASAGPSTRGGRLTRALPLAIGEALLGHADPIAVAPVVVGAGTYVAKRAWALPEMLALSPVHGAACLVAGRLLAVEPLAIELEVWDLRAGTRAAKVTASGDVDDVITRVVTGIVEVLAGKRRRGRGTIARPPPRALPPQIVEPFTAAQVDALGDVELALFAAGGAFPARALLNPDAAIEALRACAADGSMRARLCFVAFVVCALAAGVPVDASARDEASETASAMARQWPALTALTALAASTDRLRTSASG